MDTPIQRQVNWQEVVVTIITCLVLLASMYVHWFVDVEPEEAEKMLYASGIVVLAMMIWSVAIAKQVDNGAAYLHEGWGIANAIAALAFCIIAYWWNDGFFSKWWNSGYVAVFVVLFIWGGIYGMDMDEEGGHPH